MDTREISHKWYSRFDETRMVIVVYEDDEAEFAIPAIYEVCGTCGGKGKHVNPSIDSHGLSREDFDADPDFAESYIQGDYDVACAECHGARVSPVPDWDCMDEETKKKVEEAMDYHYRNERENWEAREYGY